MAIIPKDFLVEQYLKKKKSAAQVAASWGCSTNAVNYWLKRYKIPKRSISEAIYSRSNPSGDPFKFRAPGNATAGIIYGLGLGLYWGEGTKSNKHSVRLGNTDPRLIQTFISFLEKCFSVNRRDIRFGLQIFSDTDPQKALLFWQKELRARPEQFLKPVVTPSRGKGTYKRKIPHGVLTVYYHNKRLRDILVKELENTHGI